MTREPTRDAVVFLRVDAPAPPALAPAPASSACCPACAGACTTGGGSVSLGEPRAGSGMLGKGLTVSEGRLAFDE